MDPIHMQMGNKPCNKFYKACTFVDGIYNIDGPLGMS